MPTKKTYDTAEKRWAGIGPYYAMFPSSFADKVIQKYTSEKDIVIDPFAGRATAVYSAAIHKRVGIGIEINPVGWVYGKAKLKPAAKDAVNARIMEIGDLAKNYKNEAKKLPTFFTYCFSSTVLPFLLAARDNLNWRQSQIDCTTMALLLVYLHGKMGQSLSNQMRQTKSMAPDYAVRWWKEKDSKPPRMDPVQFMQKRLEWRYAKGIPDTNGSKIYLGNNIEVLPKLDQGNAKLLFTSPPYCGVTNYFYDQWLRLWLLGYSSTSYVNYGKYQGRFGNKENYREMLLKTFTRAGKLLTKDATIYIRTDKRAFTFDTTIEVLKEVFPKKKTSIKEQPFKGPTQTRLFGDHAPKKGEVDIIMI